MAGTRVHNKRRRQQTKSAEKHRNKRAHSDKNYRKSRVSISSGDNIVHENTPTVRLIRKLVRRIFSKLHFGNLVCAFTKHTPTHTRHQLFPNCGRQSTITKIDLKRHTKLHCYHLAFQRGENKININKVAKEQSKSLVQRYRWWGYFGRKVKNLPDDLCHVVERGAFATENVSCDAMHWKFIWECISVSGMSMWMNVTL